ncbi:MAG: hypothetical protein ACXVCY_08820 [Pseudobdellovibrionaceae bacterium]
MKKLILIIANLTIFCSHLALAEQKDLVNCDIYLKKKGVRSNVILDNSIPQYVKVDREKTLELLYMGDSISLKLTRPPTNIELKEFKKKMGRNEVGLGPINIVAAATSFDGRLGGATLSSEYVYVDCNMDTK